MRMKMQELKFSVHGSTPYGVASVKALVPDCRTLLS